MKTGSILAVILCVVAAALPCFEANQNVFSSRKLKSLRVTAESEMGALAGLKSRSLSQATATSSSSGEFSVKAPGVVGEGHSGTDSGSSADAAGGNADSTTKSTAIGLFSGSGSGTAGSGASTSTTDGSFTVAAVPIRTFLIQTLGVDAASGLLER